MRKLLFVAIAIAMLASTWVAYAAPPPEGFPEPAKAPLDAPPGLAKAIAAQEKHNPQLLTTPGVVGTAVGLGEDGTAVVRVFTAKPGVGHIPSSLDGVPAVVQVTGKLVALKKPAEKAQNTPPLVTITSPLPGPPIISGTEILFEAMAVDSKGTDLSSKVDWASSIDGPFGTGTGFTRTLSPGIHTVTASATDKRRKTGTDSVTVTVEGIPGQLTTTDWWPRPVPDGVVPVGVSTGNYQQASAGTIACRVVDASDSSKVSKVYALSNAHVYAPNDIDGQTEIGDLVTQPGLYDVDNNDYDTTLDLGELSAYKPIDGSIFAVNDIDAAIALTDTSRLGNSTPVALGGYGVPNSATKPAALNMAVQKFGRTTGITHGTVTGINATTAVAYADNWYAWFAGQIIVEKAAGGFIQPGDSGSLLVTDDDAANPVGLLFGGNAEGTMALANPIDNVLVHFNVEIDGKVTP